MRSFSAIGLTSLLVTWTLIPVILPGAAPADQQPARQKLLEKGKYLTHQVAMCVQCHSPHRADGSLSPQEIFSGNRIPVASPFPQQRWATFAPKIRGLPGGRTEADVVQLLSMGTWPDGESPMAPMPPFRLNKSDAQAVAVYLNSLR